MLLLKLHTYVYAPSEAKMIGLSGLETSVKQKTSASPSDASTSFVIVSMLDMLGV